MKTSVFKLVPLAVLAVGASLPLGLAQKAAATENVPHAPFAAWADLPAPGQLVAGLFYDESESYHIWANGGQRYNVNTSAEGEDYGIDINQGYLTFQYGFNEKWAADLNVGATTTGWRTFSNDGSPGSIRSTTGLMDLAFGVRYQIFNEATDTNFAWMPTLTFRAGAVLPGSYSQNFPFAPGVRSAAIEPEFLIKKHFGWTGRPEMTRSLLPSVCYSKSKAGNWMPDTGICKRSTAPALSMIPAPRRFPPATARMRFPRCAKTMIPLRRVSVTPPPNGTSSIRFTPAPCSPETTATRNSGLAAASKCPSSFSSAIKLGSPAPRGAS
jgi:hypothetical protein